MTNSLPEGEQTNSLPEGEQWSPFNETREWSAATTEAGCYKLAKRKGKKLVQIINTEQKPLPYICIFEDYPND